MAGFEDNANANDYGQPVSIAKAMGLSDIGKDGIEDQLDAVNVSRLLGSIKAKWDRATLAKRRDEQRAMKAYRNFRGIYGDEIRFREDEKSRVFIKITKTKILAAYGQICDVIFASNRFPISIEPATLPDGIKEEVHVNPPNDKIDQSKSSTDPNDVYGWAGDGKDIQPGTTLYDLLGPAKEELQNQKVEDGPGLFPGSITVEPALLAAKKMQKKILDQLDKSNACEHLRHAAFECVLLGSGIIKGPLGVDVEYARWDKEGNYTPDKKLVPTIESVSFWNLYPDPDATTRENADYMIERHKMTREMLRALKKRPYFRANAIEACIAGAPKYTKQWWEDQLRDYPNNYNVNRYEVLEYWGMIDREIAEEEGIEIPDELKNQDEIQCNVWVCGNHVLRIVLNPFTPKRIPYYIVPYELNPYTLFGVGIGENMEDTQTLMNGFMRLAIDNAALSGNVILEVDENMLAPGQDMALHPGKMFRRVAGAPGQSMYAINIPNIAQENMQIFDKARELADESTGIPSYSHGQTGVQGMTRTASGMSMLMGAAAGNIKTVVKNFDDYLLRPIGEAYYAFNQQFDFDPELNEELYVKARGTDSLMQNEVRSQRLMSFLQIVSNPLCAPFAKIPYILRSIARSMDLDEDKVTNNTDEATMQAWIMAGTQNMMGQNGSGSAPPSPSPAPGANPADTSGAGGGNIGTGSAPGPNTPGFSANTGNQ